MFGILDGDRWRADRLRFLRAQLADTVAGPERQAIEEEIAAVVDEQTAGRRARRRWLLWGARLPGP